MSVGGGLTRRQLVKDMGREHFSDYLPWIAYDSKAGRYLTQEGALGHLWECTPVPFADEHMFDALSGCLRLAYPSRAVFQVMLYADSNIARFKRAFLENNQRNIPICQTWSERYIKFLESGTCGLSSMSGIPVRNFRLFVMAKSGEKGQPLSEDTVNGIEEFLKGAKLYPRAVTPDELLSVMRSIFRGRPSGVYDPTIPIRRQVLGADDDIAFKADHMVIGKQYAKCLTPKVLPPEIDALKINQFFGGIMGLQNDTEQIDVPFLFSLNILPESVGGNITAKAEVMGMQKTAGSFVGQLRKRLDEYQWALQQLDKTTFMRVIPSMLLLAPTLDQVRNSAARVKRMWEGRGAIVQEEKRIQRIMSIVTLPGGLYNTGRTVELLDRHFVVPMDVAARLMPIQADFSGGGQPIQAWIGRKGQLIGTNIFDPSVPNHNILVAANSGAGKSVTTQMMLMSHFRAGCRIRVIDIGYSYRKLTSLVGGQYIDIGEGVVLNPFDHIHSSRDIVVTTHIIAQMCYSNRMESPTEVVMALIGEAVSWAVEQEKPEDGVSLVGKFLREYPTHSQETITDHMQEVIRTAHTLAYTMREFVGEGRYARYFHGRSTVDIGKNDWTVLELERLIAEDALFPVIVLMVVHNVTSELYQAEAGDRVPTFILFDEAWKFLNKSGSDTENSIKNVIEEGYRRARKYGGSFTIVTQSLLDIKRFGATGDVIWNNSAFRYLLASSDYGRAAMDGIVDYDPFTQKLLESVRLVKPRYSEVFMDSPHGKGLARLTLDPFSYWMFTSDSTDNAKIEQLVKQGRTYEQAISELASDPA